MQVMGVLNVTDDSFSDGGCYLDLDDAVKHGLAMAAAGAGIVDVGGESSRPGATRVDPAVETSRVIPVVKELAAQGITVSIDTMRADVARAALQNGAQMVNDVSGGRADPAMGPLLAEADVPWVLMHWRAVSADTPHVPVRYGNVVAEVRADAGQQASTRQGWCSIPGLDSPRRRNIIGRSCMPFRNWSRPESQCWWVLRASASSVRCWPGPTA